MFINCLSKKSNFLLHQYILLIGIYNYIVGDILFHKHILLPISKIFWNASILVDFYHLRVQKHVLMDNLINLYFSLIKSTNQGENPQNPSQTKMGKEIPPSLVL